jgi:hypothetical protein
MPAVWREIFADALGARDVAASEHARGGA